jgi:hypothetical protein
MIIEERAINTDSTHIAVIHVCGERKNAFHFT